MTTKNEWVSAFELINGKKPTKTQINNAIKNGQISENESDSKKEAIRQAKSVAKNLSEQTTIYDQKIMDILTDGGSKAKNSNKNILPAANPSNKRTLDILKAISIVVAALFSIGMFGTIVSNANGFGSTIASFFSGIIFAAITFVALYLVVTVIFMFLENSSVTAENVRFIAKKMDESKKK